MKNKIGKLLLVSALALSSVALTESAQAYWRGGVWYNDGGVSVNFGSGYYGDRYYSNRYYYRHHRVHCRWVPGHWEYGYWYPAQRVCWRR